MPGMKRTVALIGDVNDIKMWSGTAYHFYKSGEKEGLFHLGWDVKPESLKINRVLWNLKSLIQYGQFGGYQYSETFLDKLEKGLPIEWLSSEIISFSQHFPRSATIKNNNGKVWRYIDATLKQIFEMPGYNYRVRREMKKKALLLEHDNYQQDEGIVTMSQWAAKSVIMDYNIPEEKVHTILPGANIHLAKPVESTNVSGAMGIDRPFKMLFIGKDWSRKGLDILFDIARSLYDKGYKVELNIIGEAPKKYTKSTFVKYHGFIDKTTELDRFIYIVKSCDIGCLFSLNEALGISILEFLRLGIPVMGFAHEGISDTIPPDAGFRFLPGTGVRSIVDTVGNYLCNPDMQCKFQNRAKEWSQWVTWERCIDEWTELINTGRISHQIQPREGLESYLDYK